MQSRARAHGILTRWHDERGFGFITTALTGKEIFVHISAFASAIPRPKVGERLAFELHIDPNRRTTAVRVERTGYSSPPADVRRPTGRAVARKPEHPRQVILAIGFVVAAVLYICGEPFHSAAPLRLSEERLGPARQITDPSIGNLQEFACDGRTRCSQMTSCKEAYFFLRNCPGTAMDGDRDGVPCEQQWCGSE